MKALISTLLWLSLSVMVLAQSYTGDTWSSAAKAKKGKVSLAYVETPGFVYKGESGQLTGICVDIMHDFAAWVKDSKGVDLELQFVGDGSSFTGMYERTKNGKGGVFGLGNVTITDARKKEVRFSPPFITNTAILVTQPSAPTLENLADMPTAFAGFTAYAAKGTLNEKRTLALKEKYYPSLKVVTTTTSQETLEKVFADPKGFAYLDMTFYIEAVQLKKPVKRHAVGDQSSEQFGIVMPANSDWGPVLDEFFAARGGYLNSKEYRDILVKHLGLAGMKLINAIK